jgi:hypothetical protein
MPAVFIIRALFNDAVTTVVLLSFEKDDYVWRK